VEHFSLIIRDFLQFSARGSATQEIAEPCPMQREPERSPLLQRSSPHQACPDLTGKPQIVCKSRLIPDSADKIEKDISVRREFTNESGGFYAE
jgi:hypothetical protein